MLNVPPFLHGMTPSCFCWTNFFCHSKSRRCCASIILCFPHPICHLYIDYFVNSDSWRKLCSSHPGPFEVVQSIKYHFFFYVAFVVGAHNFGCFHASSESVGIFTWYIGTRNRGISHLIVVFFTNFSRFKAKRKYQFLTKTVGSFGTTTTLNIRWVNSKSQFVIPFRCYFQTSTWNIKPNNCNMKCPGDEWNGKLRLETTINCKKYFDISASFHVLKPPWRNSLSFQTDWGPARRCLCSAVGFLIPTNLVWTREKLQQLDLCVC